MCNIKIQSEERDRCQQILNECCVMLGGITVQLEEIPNRLASLLAENKALRVALETIRDTQLPREIAQAVLTTWVDTPRKSENLRWRRK